MLRVAKMDGATPRATALARARSSATSERSVPRAGMPRWLKSSVSTPSPQPTSWIERGAARSTKSNSAARKPCMSRRTTKLRDPYLSKVFPTTTPCSTSPPANFIHGSSCSLCRVRPGQVRALNYTLAVVCRDLPARDQHSGRGEKSISHSQFQRELPCTIAPRCELPPPLRWLCSCTFRTRVCDESYDPRVSASTRSPSSARSRTRCLVSSATCWRTSSVLRRTGGDASCLICVGTSRSRWWRESRFSSAARPSPSSSARQECPSYCCCSRPSTRPS